MSIDLATVTAIDALVHVEADDRRHHPLHDEPMAASARYCPAGAALFGLGATSDG